MGGMTFQLNDFTLLLPFMIEATGRAYRFPLLKFEHLSWCIYTQSTVWGLLEWINDACGGYPNIELHLSDRATTKTEAVDALIRLRCLHNVCSHSSLGSLCFSLIRIMGHHCPHLSIISTDKAAEGTHQWSHSACEDSCYFSKHTLGQRQKSIQHVCQLSDKLITFLAPWCYLRGGIEPHTHTTMLIYSYVFHSHDVE